MKYKKHLFTLLTGFLWLPLWGQTTLEISPYGGLNYPTAEFRDFSENGFVAGLHTDLFFAKKWGVGLDINHQSADFSLPIDLSLIPAAPMMEYAISSSTLSRWRNTTLALGPTIRLGSGKVNLDIYSKAGISFINKPLAESTFTFSGIDKEVFAFSNPGDESAISLIAGFRLNADLSERWSIFLNPHYVYSLQNIGYQTVDIADAFFVDPNGIETFDPGLLIEQPLRASSFKISQLGLAAGVKVKFGGKKEKRPSEDPVTETDNCDLNLTVDTIYCQSPYRNTSTGNILYSGRVKIINTGTSNLQLQSFGGVQQLLDINTGTINVTGTANSASANCLSIPISSAPIRLSPTQAIWLCFDIEVPVSISSVSIRAVGLDYISDRCKDISEVMMDLPNCVCNGCNQMGLAISDNANQLNLVNIKVGYQDIQYTRGTVFADIAATTPVKRIKAEIIYYEQLSSNKECNLCNKAPQYQVHFYNQNANITGLNNIVSGGNTYQNFNNGNRQGVLFSPNGELYSNEVNWYANTSTTGADISGGLRIKLDMALPQIRQLACCKEEAKICIRYKVIDINNEICEKIVCYSGELDLSNSPGLGTGVGTDPGNISNGTNSPAQRLPNQQNSNNNE